MHSSFVSGGKDYFNFVDFQIKGDVQLSDFVEALRTAWNHHAMLRTGFLPTEIEGNSFSMVQYLSSALTIPVTAVARDKGDSFNLDRWRSEAAEQAFRNIQVPPWSAAAVELEGGISMHLAIHHALYDATSLQLILQDIDKILRGESLLQHRPVDSCVLDISGQASAEVAQAEAFLKSKLKRQ